MFWFKKIVALLISPLGVLLILLAGALFLHWRQRFGNWPGRVVVAASIGLILVTTAPAGELMLAPLEGAHPPLTAPHTADGVTHIVVLGGGYTAYADRPVTSELSPASTVRLTEGVRIHHHLDDTTLVVSGAAVSHPGSTAEAMAELAGHLGVDTDELAVSDTPRDTAEEAAAVDLLVDDGDAVIIVTSASHMPRAMRLFERAGIPAVAAPTHHLTTGAAFHPGNLWPAARNVRRVERALYEYVALTWIWFGGS